MVPLNPHGVFDPALVLVMILLYSEQSIFDVSISSFDCALRSGCRSFPWTTFNNGHFAARVEKRRLFRSFLVNSEIVA